MSGNQKKIIFLLILALAVLLLWAVPFYLLPVFRGDREIMAQFYLGPVRFSAYGLLFALAVIVGYALSRKLLGRAGVDRRHADDALPWVVVGGLLGARLYHVLFSLPYYREHWLETLAVYRGGLAIYGALFGGLVGLYLYARYRKLGFLKTLDVAAVALPLAQSIGRWGNFFNQEAFGSPTALPWRLYVPPAARPAGYLEESFFHPAFLYESLWNLGVFFVVLSVFRRVYPGDSVRPGLVAGVYLVLYSVGRFLIEGLRLDSFYVNGIKADQVTALAAVLIGGFLIWRSYAHTNLAVG